MGISSGLPLSLTGGTLHAWLKTEGVSTAAIGWFALVGLPYTWKFVWAPLMDRFTYPFLGRRRGWMLVTQLLLIILIAVLGQLSPKTDLYLISVIAFFVAFVSASQDVVLDAWRREQLTPQEFGWGNGIHVTGYLFAMRLLSGSLALIMSDHVSWSVVYLTMAGLQGLGVIATLWSKESNTSIAPPKSLKEAVVAPFLDFFSRDRAMVVLAFILFYKLGDNMASQMTMPFYLEMGYSKTQIGGITKIFGWAGIALGTFLGGLWLRYLSVYRGLFIFGLLQMLSTFGFSILVYLPKTELHLTWVILFENISAGMGTAAFVTFIGLMTNKQFTATQFALLSSVMGIPRVFIAAPTGHLAEYLGWFGFFALCTLVAIVGLALIKLLPSIDDHQSPKGQ